MLLASIPFWKRILPHALGIIAAYAFWEAWWRTGEVLFSSLKCLGYTPEYCEFLRTTGSGPQGIQFVILAVLLSQIASYLVVWYLTRLVLGATRRQRRRRELTN